jgi:hypothetical protein
LLLGISTRDGASNKHLGEALRIREIAQQALKSAGCFAEPIAGVNEMKALPSKDENGSVNLALEESGYRK